MNLNVIKKALPEDFKKHLRPTWDRFKLYADFFAEGGRLFKDPDLKNYIATRSFGGRPLPIVVRSKREFKRWANFYGENRETMHDWMTNLKGCEVVWDFGAANGLEGFYLNHMHGAKIVFVEPFTPSIETILKTIYYQQKMDPSKRGKFEVLQAVVDDKTKYQRLDIHDKPLAGETLNSASEGKSDYCHGGRLDKPVAVSQWLSSVCMNDMLNVFKLPAPTHVKMDIDGYELRALYGAKELLASGCVKEWCIEVTDQKGAEVIDILDKAGYKKVAEYMHYPNIPYSPTDYIFVKK